MNTASVPCNRGQGIGGRRRRFLACALVVQTEGEDLEVSCSIKHQASTNHVPFVHAGIRRKGGNSPRQRSSEVSKPNADLGETQEGSRGVVYRHRECLAGRSQHTGVGRDPDTDSDCLLALHWVRVLTKRDVGWRVHTGFTCRASRCPIIFHAAAAARDGSVDPGSVRLSKDEERSSISVCMNL